MECALLCMQQEACFYINIKQEVDGTTMCHVTSFNGSNGGLVNEIIDVSMWSSYIVAP